MTEIAKINFYNIHRCGYHSRGNDTSSFASVASVFSEFHAWAFDGEKPLADTCTYEVTEGDNILRTFCFDSAISRNGDIILVTWNESESLGGRIASVNGTQPAGEASIDSNEIPEGHIPGYPTYFWVIPRRRVFATLRFGQVLNGHAGFKQLMSGFLEKFTSHAIYAEDDVEDEINIIGFSETGEAPVENVHPYFWTSHKKLPGRSDYIIRNRTRIRKIIRKTILSGEDQDDRGLFEKMLNELGIINTPQTIGDLKVKSEIPYTPSEEELNQLMAAWEDAPDTSWTDVGFEISGENEIHWLSHTLVKIEQILEVNKDDNGLISAESLLHELTEYRSQLLQIL